MAKRYLSERPIVSSVSYRHKEFKAVVWDGKGTALAISQHCDEAALQCLELTLFSLSGCGSGRELALLDDAALPRWGKGRCGGAEWRCLPHRGKGAVGNGASDFDRYVGSGRNTCALRPACCQTRQRTAGVELYFPSEQGHASGGATADSARTRSRDKSLENPICCREAHGCYNDSRAAPARGPSGALRTLSQPKTQQRTPALYSWGRGSPLTSGSSVSRHCRPP